MRIKLKRLSLNINVTLGVLINEDKGLPFLVTLELPDKGNKRNISCIPKGIYEVIYYSSVKYSEAYLIKDVPNRNNILIHAGNTVDDTEGCILTGEYYCYTSNGLPMVGNSREALKILHSLRYDKFELIIE